MDVRHSFLVAQDIPDAVAGQDEEAVCLGQLDGVHLRPRNDLLLVPQAVPFTWGVHLVSRGSRCHSDAYDASNTAGGEDFVRRDGKRDAIRRCSFASRV